GGRPQLRLAPCCSERCFAWRFQSPVILNKVDRKAIDAVEGPAVAFLRCWSMNPLRQATRAASYSLVHVPHVPGLVTVGTTRLRGPKLPPDQPPVPYPTISGAEVLF